MPTIGDTRRRILRNIGIISHSQHKRVLFIGLIITLLLGATAIFKLKANVDLIHLLSSSSVVKRFDYALEDFDSTSSLAVVIESSSPDNIEKAQQLSDYLASQILELKDDKSEKLVKRIDYKIDADFFRKRGLLYFSPEDLEKIKDFLIQKKDLLQSLLPDFNTPNFYETINSIIAGSVEDALSMTDEEISQQLDTLLNILVLTSNYIEKGDKFDSKGEEVLDALQNFLLQGKKVEGMEMLQSPYFLTSPDKKFILMPVQPNQPRMDMSTVEGKRRRQEQLYRLTAAVKKVIEEAEKKPEFSSLRIGLIGEPALIYEWVAAIWKDMGSALLVAIVAIAILLLILYYRNPFNFVLAITPVVMSVIWMLGITALFPGYLTIFTATCASLIIALGVDFAVYLILRYEEERRAERNIKEAIDITMTTTGQTILTSGATMALAFYVLMITGFQGLAEMGFIVGTGILICIAVTFFVVPALITWWETRSIRMNRASVLAQRRRLVTGVFDDMSWHFELFIAKYYKLILVVLILITLFFGYQLKNAQISYDWVDMQSVGEAIKWQRKVMKSFDMSLDFGIVIADDIKTNRVMADKLSGYEDIAMVDSLVLFYPDRQKEKLPMLKELDENIGDLEVDALSHPITRKDKPRIEAELDNLSDSLQEFSLNAFIGGLDRTANKTEEMASFTKGLKERIADDEGSIEALARLEKNTYARMKQLIGEFKEMTKVEEITLDSLPPALIQKYTGKEDDYITFVYPAEDIWGKERLTNYVSVLQKVDPEATGVGALFSQLMREIMPYFIRTSIISLLIIIQLLYIDFGTLRATLSSIIPMLIGAIWMMGMITLLGMKINAVNIIAVPIIFGIGSSSGVYILHRYRTDGVPMAIAISHSGRVILISALTSIAGFGSLAFASHRGLESLGRVLSWGIFFCFMASLIVLPVVIKMILRREEVPTEVSSEEEEFDIDATF